MRFAHLLLSAFLLFAPAGAGAQEQAKDDDEIIVTGTADRKKQVDTFVRALTDVTAASPMGRFDWTSVCPGAAGLSPAQNLAIAERMRFVASAVGLKVAKPGCKPNALVIVAQDKNQLIRALRKAHPIYFQDPAGRQVEIPKQSGPATAWHLQGRLDRTGVPLQEDPEGGFDIVNTPVGASRISATMRPIFLASVVVIELASLDGLTTTQAADYAAMRTFVQTDPARLSRSSAPTILTVLEAPMESVVPASLTHWDLSYLKAVYASEKYHFGPRQRSELKRRMDRNLRRAGEGGE